AGAALRFLPERQRIKFILNGMVDALRKSNSQVEVWLDDGQPIAFYDATCGVCHGRKSETPICHLYAGSIGEAVEWATGKPHQITETHCMAKGDDYCRFEIGEALVRD
ncbi:MAG TPA: 4-vinyl reductase, partial [Anaerolineales bacterium]